MPKVSVISPAYNHEKYIAEAISSVLNQTYQDWEYIIADDVSSDGTLAEIRKFNDPRISVIAQEFNVGASLNAETCYNRTTGQYIALLTTDDRYKPRALETLARVLDENPNVLAVFGAADTLNENGDITGQWTNDGVGLNRYELLRCIFFQKHVLCAPTLMARRKVYETLGYFPPHYKQINDVALWVKFLFMGDVAVVADKILEFRIRDNNGNTSAPTQNALTRFSFEISEVLETYAQEINSIEKLLQVFPEVSNFAEPKEDILIPYFLSKLALSFDHPAYKLFGIRLLHRLFSDSGRAKTVQALTGFGYPQLFELTGNTLIFAEPNFVAELKHLRATCDQQSASIKALESELRDMRSHCTHLELQNSEIVSSTSWRVTAPLRSFMRRTRGG